MRLPAPKPSVIFKELADGAVLYCSESEVYFGLNALGVAIWESLPPVLHTLDELVAEISNRFPDASPETIRSDAVEFMEDLVESGLAAR